MARQKCKTQRIAEGEADSAIPAAITARPAQ
jgi:hypothetical protein